MVGGCKILSAWLHDYSRLHVLHDVFVERFVIRNAALAVHAPKNRVVNAVMQKVYEFAKTPFWNEVGGSFEFGLDVFEKH